MPTHKLFGAILLAITTLTPIAAAAHTASAASTTVSAACSLKTHRITSVTPLRVKEHMGHATYSHLRGANVFVLAEPGLTKEWLQLTLAQHLTEMRGMPMTNCPFDLKDVTISVKSAGPGFNVRIVARDTKKAQEVLRRAQLLLGRPSADAAGL